MALDHRPAPGLATGMSIRIVVDSKYRLIQSVDVAERDRDEVPVVEELLHAVDARVDEQATHAERDRHPIRVAGEVDGAAAAR